MITDLLTAYFMMVFALLVIALILAVFIPLRWADRSSRPCCGFPVRTCNTEPHGRVRG